MKRHGKEQRGFTLVETTIALLVMMVVGLGAASLFVYSINNNSGASDRALALAVAQQQMEQLRRTAFNGAALAVNTAGTTTTVTNAGRPFRVVTTVANSAGVCSGCTAAKLVTIRVWAPGNISQTWASTPITVRMLRPAHNNGPYARS